MITQSVIVIGSGIGGSAVGALLANKGHRVTLYEKSNLIGGRFATYERDGFKLDVGCHMIANCDKGRLGKVLDICGGSDYVSWNYAKNPSPVINFKGTWVKFPFEAHKMGFSETDLENFFRFYQDIREFSEADCRAHENISIREFVDRYLDSNIARSFVGFFSSIYFVTRDAETPLGEYARDQNEIARMRSLGYPVGGTGAVPRAYCRIIEENGGAVHTGAAVDSILIEDGRAVGVKLHTGEIKMADIVISNNSIKSTVTDLVGATHYPAAFVETINSYTYSYSTYVLKIALDQVISKESMIFYIGSEDLTEVEDALEKTGQLPEAAPHLMVPIVSNLDPESAPPGKQLLVAGSAPKQPYTAGRAVWEKWEKAMMASLKVLFPDIEEHILWMETTSPEDINNFAGEEGSVIGIAQTLSQVGENRPPFVDPCIQNLYHCSADTGVSGIGGELAADAALRLYDYLT